MSDADSGRNGRVYDPDADHAFPDERLNETLTYLDKDPEITAYLEAQNVNPVTRKKYNDHGKKHVSIVRNRALCLYDLLKGADVPFNGAADQGLDEADESVIIALAAELHADAVRMKGEVLHAILCHTVEQEPLTTEAGVVRVGDALDMEEGRSRIPYERGGRGINTVSSQAIKRVSLQPGDDYGVLVEIEMSNAAGVYQVDNLLKAKLHGSGLEESVRIVAINEHDEPGQIVERIEL
jgi:hypothetical protein